MSDSDNSDDDEIDAVHNQNRKNTTDPQPTPEDKKPIAYNPEPQALADVVVRSKDGLYTGRFHRAILMNKSRVFRETPALGDKPPEDGGELEIVMDYSSDVLMLFFELLYTGITPETKQRITLVQILPVLRVAVAYDVTWIIEYCINTIDTLCKIKHQRYDAYIPTHNTDAHHMSIVDIVVELQSYQPPSPAFASLLARLFDVMADRADSAVNFCSDCVGKKRKAEDECVARNAECSVNFNTRVIEKYRKLSNRSRLSLLIGFAPHDVRPLLSASFL